jgi:hypothetical protein
MKDDYIETVKEAGFQGVRVVDETFYPVDSMADGPTAIIKDSQIPPEKLAQYANSVLSMKVHAVKPG